MKCDQEQLKLDLRERGEVTLWLKNECGKISLMADEGDGMGAWFVLTIEEGKAIKLHSACPHNFFIPVEDRGVPKTMLEWEE